MPSRAESRNIMSTTNKGKAKKLTQNPSELWTPYKSVISDREMRVMQTLLYARTDGATWRQLSETLDLHHGQISGVLNGLHQLGLVFMLRERKDRCHPYVSHLFRDLFTDEQVYDEPPMNKGKERRNLLNELLAECLSIRDNGSNDYITSKVSDILDQIIEHDGGIVEPEEIDTESEAQAVDSPRKNKRVKQPRRHRGRQTHTVEREQHIMETVKHMQIAGFHDPTAQNIAILTGYSEKDIYSSLHILKNRGFIGYQRSKEPATKGKKLVSIIKWDEDIDHFVAK